MNDDITADSVRLIDADGEQVGVVSVAEGIGMADEAGLDLVEVSRARPLPDAPAARKRASSSSRVPPPPLPPTPTPLCDDFLPRLKTAMSRPCFLPLNLTPPVSSANASCALAAARSDMSFTVHAVPRPLTGAFFLCAGRLRD